MSIKKFRRVLNHVSCDLPKNLECCGLINPYKIKSYMLLNTSIVYTDQGIITVEKLNSKTKLWNGQDNTWVDIKTLSKKEQEVEEVIFLLIFKDNFSMEVTFYDFFLLKNKLNTPLHITELKAGDELLIYNVNEVLSDVEITSGIVDCIVPNHYSKKIYSYNLTTNSSITMGNGVIKTNQTIN